tara:strand:- start:1546 stop:2118 length:573 start_codon:yes stop_codon:yes gene_type:complete
MRILTDADGVLLNWEYAFNTWMECHGYKITNDASPYDMGERYGLTQDKKRELVRYFNESSSIGFLPPLRDAIQYVRKLHEEFGAVFHCITSLSLEHTAQKLREQNINKLFGEGVFEKFVFCDTGADKDEALAPYKDCGDLWIEDKVENAILGRSLGLDSILIEHGHNMFDTSGIPLHKNWKSVYEYVKGV